MRARLLLFMATLCAVLGLGLNGAADAQPNAPGEPAPPQPVTAAEYHNALVEAIHHFADDALGYDNLRALLARHPKLVNERRKGEVRGKPSYTDSYTALHFATRRGNEKAVALLIEYKANVNATDGLDWTPLHNAAQNGNLEVVKMLVKAGAKLDAKTHPLPGGLPPGSPPGAPGEPPPKPLPPVPAMTPLDVAKDAKKADVVKYLESVKP